MICKFFILANIDRLRYYHRLIIAERNYSLDILLL